MIVMDGFGVHDMKNDDIIDVIFFVILIAFILYAIFK